MFLWHQPLQTALTGEQELEIQKGILNGWLVSNAYFIMPPPPPPLLSLSLLSSSFCLPFPSVSHTLSRSVSLSLPTALPSLCLSVSVSLQRVNLQRTPFWRHFQRARHLLCVLLFHSISLCRQIWPPVYYYYINNRSGQPNLKQVIYLPHTAMFWCLWGGHVKQRGDLLVVPGRWGRESSAKGR